MSSGYEPVIGLEVHAQLLTTTKAFCSCMATYGAPPNTRVCPTCLGLPGALPVLNERAVRLAVRTALALGCTIERISRFARKNYFYPDLPKGYQISQYDEPFSRRGLLEIEVGGQVRRAGITRVHMEEDAGKSVHGGAAGGGQALVDFNRSGIPLVEIVGEPDLGSAEEAAEYLRTLRELLLFIEVNDGNLEEGSFRCDANVSVRPRGSEVLGTRVELKNINSFRFVQKAIAHEVARQEALLEGGGAVVAETRGWDEDTQTTFSMRTKETAQDYRYLPEPDLPPLVLDEAFVAVVRSELPELPRQKRARYVAEHALPPVAAAVLTQHPRVAALYEEAVALGLGKVPAVRVANFIQSEVLRDVVTKGLAAELPVSAAQIADLLSFVEVGTISGKQAKAAYAAVAKSARTIADVVGELGLAQVSDASVLEEVVQKVLAASPKQVAQLRAGKTGVMGYLVGQVMKETQGSTNPRLANELIEKHVGKPS
jgi:aspartyl-tRNA(Asn)/glutamyl-tRNA(Gln) amidotransferase subunit B